MLVVLDILGEVDVIRVCSGFVQIPTDLNTAKRQFADRGHTKQGFVSLSSVVFNAKHQQLRLMNTKEVCTVCMCKNRTRYIFKYL